MATGSPGRDSHVLGREGETFAYLAAGLPQDRLTIAIAIAIGAVASDRAALQATIDYTRERQVFGRRVAAFQTSSSNSPPSPLKSKPVKRWSIAPSRGM